MTRLAESSPAPVTVVGTFFDGRSSRAREAALRFSAPTLHLRVDDTETALTSRDLRFEPPLGTLRRVVHLPGGGRFETDDLVGLAAIERALGKNRGLSLVNALERRWQAVLGGLVAIVIATALFWQFGLPVAARLAANATPHVMLDALDTQTLALVDRQFTEPSKLPRARQTALRAEFDRLSRAIDPSFSYRLEFRRSEHLGANAFALPGGTVVMTDDLVRLAKNDRELYGVLAHEVGHITKRHGMRGIYQSAGLLLFVSVLTGDVSAASTVAGTLGLLLVQNGYSRDAEREADDIGGAYMLRAYGTTRPLRDILTRLSKDAGEQAGELGLLNTHPGTSERVARLRAMGGR